MTKINGWPFPIVMCAIACLSLTGCATPKHPWSPELHSHPPAAQVLQAGDSLEISFLGAPNLNTMQKIRRDGCVTLGILGDIRAADKTPQMLRAELMRLYGTQLQITEIAILVRSETVVFVTGAVLQPGPQEATHPFTAFEAVMKAGGFNEQVAKPQNVIVIREVNGKRKGFSIDMKAALKGKEVPVFYLEPYDVVYVPRTNIAKVDEWVDQYINKLIPNPGINMSYGAGGDWRLYY
jgi:polysaccharide biosynthesis/export protein